MRTVADMLGLTFTSVELHRCNGDDVITFTADNGDQYKLYHAQDCCESVYVEKMEGDLDVLTGSPLIIAEENESNENPPGVKIEYQDDLFAWTRYRFATAKGEVNILWYGQSNGFYSVSVNFCKVGE